MRISAALGAILVIAAAGAHAQERRPGGPPGQLQARMAEHRAQAARDMKTLLRLRPDQEVAWGAYQAALAPPQHRPGPREPGGPALATPQRLDEMDRRMAEHEARRARAGAATRTFYASLSSEQQQAFDAAMRLRAPHGGRGPDKMRPPPF